MLARCIGLRCNTLCDCRWDSNITCIELVKEKVLGILNRDPLITPVATVALAPRVERLVSQLTSILLALVVTSDGMVKVIVQYGVKVSRPVI